VISLGILTGDSDESRFFGVGSFFGVFLGLSGVPFGVDFNFDLGILAFYLLNFILFFNLFFYPDKFLIKIFSIVLWSPFGGDTSGYGLPKY